MQDTKIDFPAVIVCSRWDHGDDAPVAFVGCDPIASDAELERRLAQFRHYEEAGGRAYTYTLAALDDAERVIGERVAELEAKHRFGHRETEAGEAAPAPAETPRDEEPNPDHDTTDPGDGQVSVGLVVGYMGAFPPPPQAFSTGELVSYILDGEPAEPPAHSLAETRLWLKAHGFSPDYVRWQAIDRAVPDGQRRKRLEVWVGDGNGDGQAEPETGGYWGSVCAAPRRTAEDEARMLALAREKHGARERPADEPFIPENGWKADPWLLGWSLK